MEQTPTELQRHFKYYSGNIWYPCFLCDALKIWFKKEMTEINPASNNPFVSRMNTEA